MSVINRRGFLKRSVTTGALAITGYAPIRKTNGAPLAVIAPRRGPNEEIRVAVVGIRQQGCTHMRNHAAEKNVRVVTVCDVDERLFDERIKIITDLDKPAPKTEYDVRRVINDKDVDCISIA
ncbi:MAG: twin-arginine translocation signal domain-containing protein, partial [Planctomycetota bacterium]